MDQGNNKNQNQGGNRRDFKRDGKPFEKKFERKPGEKPFKKKYDSKPGEKKFERKTGDRPFEKKFEGRPGDRKFEGRDRRPVPSKPAGPSARDVALRALRNVARNDAYAAQALDRELSAAHLSDEDRRLASSVFYFTLENRLRIEHVLAARLKTRPEPEVMDILCIATAQILFMDKIPDHAAVDEAVKQTRRAGRDGLTALVNGVLRSRVP